MKSKADCEVCGRRAKHYLIKRGIKRCGKHGKELLNQPKEN